ncbi:MAG TPA: ribosome biogenesis GTPase Der [Candidatus Babeliales bacterium]|nr:ribosome biogenesis GTPase Der [Candidatus Babeliales bacterium]
MTKIIRRLPKVVLAGRMNVGKSTLFNRLISSNKSMAFDYAGVTRDFIADVTSWQDVKFELIDSGGVSFDKNLDQITKQVVQIVYQLLESADINVLVCDGAEGVTAEDRELVRRLRKLNKPLILAVNKTDAKATEHNKHDFYGLGVAQTIFISAEHSYAIGDLLDAIVADLHDFKAPDEVEPAYRVVLLGKPNVGKSSLMNLLTKSERAIVTPQAGTTREAIDTNVNFSKETIRLTDTAGVRRPRSINEDLEQMMVKSSFRAVKHSDIVLLMIDAADNAISDQELKLAFYTFEEHKALIILLNKQDLTTEDSQADLERRFSEYNYFFKKIEKLEISCLNKTNIGKILPLVHTVWQRQNQRFNDIELKQLFQEALDRKPLYHKTNLLIIRNVKQVQVAPLTLAMYVNVPAWFGSSQLGFFENLLRAKYDLKSVPIRFVVRKA